MKIKLSKNQWETLGKKAGWMKNFAATKFEVVDSEFNRSNYPDLIGKILDNPPAYANVKMIKTKDKTLEQIFDLQSKIFAEKDTEHLIDDFVIKALKAGYEKEDIIKGLGQYYNQARNAAESIFTKNVAKFKNLKG